MRQVAKLVIRDNQGYYLLMYRNAHPVFGDDADLPGGTLEEGESLVQTMIREVYEEIGVVIDEHATKEIYSGTEYSTHGTYKALFISTLDERPVITMSWEHSSYEWVELATFLDKAKNAKDTYMHMVHDVMKSQQPDRD